MEVESLPKEMMVELLRRTDPDSYHKLLQVNRQLSRQGLPPDEYEKYILRQVVSVSPNGFKKVYYLDRYGRKQGIEKEYYPSGELRSLTSYVDGILNGLYRQWYPNGNPKIETTYLNGKLNGLYRTWYENGKLWFEHGKSHKKSETP